MIINRKPPLMAKPAADSGGRRLGALMAMAMLATLLAARVGAQPIVGLDYLGMGNSHWPTEMTCRLTPPGTALGCFAEEFGDAIPALRAHLRTGKFSIVRVQMWWGGSSHELVPIEFLERHLPRYEQLARDFPEVTIYLSHSCEHNEGSLKKLQRRMNLIRELAPTCVPVNNPWKGATLKGEVNETHGDKALKGEYLASMDGRNAYDFDAAKWCRTHRNAKVIFGWGQLFNCNDGATPVPAPKDRTAKPDRNYIRCVLAAAKCPEPAPTASFAGVVKRVAKPCLYKPMSQDTNDNREGKPLFIAPEKSDFIELIGANGAVLGQFGYFGTFEGGMHRYYAGTHGIDMAGHEIAVRAQQACGSEWVWIKCRDVHYGPVHPVFRWGYYR